MFRFFSSVKTRSAPLLIISPPQKKICRPRRRYGSPAPRAGLALTRAALVMVIHSHKDDIYLIYYKDDISYHPYRITLTKNIIIFENNPCRVTYYCFFTGLLRRFWDQPITGLVLAICSNKLSIPTFSLHIRKTIFFHRLSGSPFFMCLLILIRHLIE